MKKVRVVCKTENVLDVSGAARREKLLGDRSRRTVCRVVGAVDKSQLQKNSKETTVSPVAHQCKTKSAYAEKAEKVLSQVLLDNRGVRQFDLDARKQQNVSFRRVDKNVDDQTRPLKTIATDIVVNEFFQTKDTLYYFLSFVHDFFDETLAQYRQLNQLSEKQLFFLFKGGNMLRFVSHEFLLELPNSATRELDDFYAPFFKRSDSDFSIYVDPRVDQYDRVFHECTLIAYLVQNEIRKEFLAHTDHYFDFFRFKRSYREQLLQPYLAKFNQAKGFENEFVNFGILNTSANSAGSFAYAIDADSTLEFVRNDEIDRAQEVRTAVQAPINEGEQSADSFMTITHNNALDFSKEGVDARTKFNLTRTKVIFTLLRKSGALQNVGGELIDVSVPHRDDDAVAPFFDDLEKKVAVYTLSSDHCRFTFKANSLLYLIKDLENVLFMRSEYPWMDRKYVKRLNRLVYLYFVDAFVRLDSGAEKLALFRNLREKVFVPLQTDPLATDISIDKSFDGDLAVQHFLGLLRSLQEKISTDQLSEFQAMTNVIVENLDKIIQVLENVRSYCSTDGRVPRSAIVGGKIGNLV